MSESVVVSFSVAGLDVPAGGLLFRFAIHGAAQPLPIYFPSGPSKALAEVLGLYVTSTQAELPHPRMLALLRDKKPSMTERDLNEEISSGQVVAMIKAEQCSNGLVLAPVMQDAMQLSLAIPVEAARLMLSEVDQLKQFWKWHVEDEDENPVY